MESRSDPETIHSLRVELKKIRFLKSLLKQYVPKAKVKKAYRPFKVLFNEAGKLRGEQVNEYRKAQAERGDESGLSDTNKKIQKLELQFCKSVYKHHKNLKKGMERMNNRMQGFPLLYPKKFVENLTYQLLQNLTPKTLKKELHHNRHLLKGILYSAEIAPSVSGLIKKRFDLDLVLKLEDAIGDWHDLSILLRKAKKKSSLLSAKGMEAARRKRNEKVTFIYQSIFRLHDLPSRLKEIG